jgi:hypothetical protein
MFGIFNNYAVPTIFIRYNPDSYSIKGFLACTTRESRHIDLLRTLKYYTDIADVNADGFLCDGTKRYQCLIKYMYYNEYEEYDGRSNIVIPIIDEKI